jgi:hypothetical protein
MPTHFAIVVDGEVAINVTYPDDMPHFEKHIAICRSGPTFIEVPEPIVEGSTWDGSTFTPPS